MSKFDFQCRACHVTTTVDSPIGQKPKAPYHHKRPMHRIWTPVRFTVQWSRAEYLERASRGEESIPGYTSKEVAQTLDKSFQRAS